MLIKLITLILLLTITSIVSGDLPKFKSSIDIPPEQIGLYHTEAFERLSKKYSLQAPKNQQAVLHDMIEIMSSYCFDNECSKHARKSVLDEDLIHARRVLDVYPEHIDPSIHDSSDIYAEYENPSLDDLGDIFLEHIDPSIHDYLESVVSTIRLVDSHEVEEVITLLSSIQDNLREATHIDEKDKYVGLAAGSVAIESTKLWTKVLSNMDHPLHVIRDVPIITSDNFANRRSLQGTNSGISSIILSDVAGIFIVPLSIFSSVAASLLAFIVLDGSPNTPVIEPSSSPPISIPSTLPPFKPTSIPSFIPSFTSFPTSSSKPSFTSGPSIYPSFTPTINPTTPTINPTTYPSVNPSLSSKPSISPTLMSTRIPSSSSSSPLSSQPSISTIPSVTPSLSAEPSLSV